MKTTILPDSTCPACGYHADACSPIEGNTRSTPVPGDITLCFGCGAVLLFDLGLQTRALAPEKVAALDQETTDQIAKIRRLLDLLRPARATA